MGISVPFIRHSIWGLSNSQQYLGCLQHPGNHQHNQIQRLSRTDLKGLLPYPDNSASLKREGWECALPQAASWSSDLILHISLHRKAGDSVSSLQETQGRRPRKLEMMVGRHTSRVPRSEGTQSTLQGASWLDLAKASKARLHYPVSFAWAKCLS